MFKFDANGDDVLYRQWSLWDSESPSAGVSDVVSDVLGSRDTEPTPGDDPPSSYPTYGLTSSRCGYVVTQAVAVVKWDVGGGMDYVE